MVAVSVSELEKRFGDTVVLDGVTLEVPDGAFAVLVGPSGCGKSTLLRLLAGLEQPSGGSIRFGEREVATLEPRERDIAMVFQSYALYPHLSVRDNLGFGLKLRKTPAAEITRRVAEASAMLGIDHLLGRMPRELSGGQRQRVAMGRAVVRRPALFLFDEPLSNLDAALRAQVRVDIRRLHQRLGVTSVYVTHDQVEAMTLADVLFVLNEGRIEQHGSPLEIYQRPATRFVAGFLGSPAMNFLEAELSEDDGGWRVRFGEQRACSLPLDPESFEGELAHGRAVTLGIRPHDVVPTADDEADALELQIDLCEALGGETYAYGTLGGDELVVRLSGSDQLRGGEAMALRVEHLHLFDADDGQALRC